MIELCVNIKSQNKNYPIYIENQNAFALKEKLIKFLEGKNFLVVISEKVEKLYGKELGFDKSIKFILKDGEKEKNFKNYKKILEKALKMKLTRHDAIVAIGGLSIFRFRRLF